MNSTAKNNRNLYLGAFGVLGAVAAITYFSKNSISETVENNLAFQFNGLRVNFDFPDVKVPIQYQIKNDNLVGASNVSFRGQLIYEGVKVGDIPATNPITIPASATTQESELVVNVSLVQLPTAIIDIFTNKSFSTNFQVKGVVSSNFGNFAVDKFVSVT